APRAGVRGAGLGGAALLGREGELPAAGAAPGVPAARRRPGLAAPAHPRRAARAAGRDRRLRLRAHLVRVVVVRGVLRRGSVRARAGGALLALLLVGCVPAPEAASPAAVVDAYFRFLGRDPMRTLPLLADAFHRRHGLGVVTAGGAAAAAPAPPPAPAAVSLDRLQLGWLAVQGRDAFRALRDTLA